MRRFNYDENEEYREDIDKFFSQELENEDLTDEQYKAIMEEEKAIQREQIDFVHRDLNHRMLRTSIRACEKSLWWRFYGHATKLKMIDITYKHFRDLEEE